MSKLEDFQNDMNEVVMSLMDEYLKPLIESDIIVKGVFDLPKEKVSKVFNKHFMFNTEKLGIRLSLFENNTNPIICDYTYNGIVIKPKGYYILKKGYKMPSQLDILHQCVKQNTHEPDIKRLQKGQELLMEYLNKNNTTKKWSGKNEF